MRRNPYLFNPEEYTFLHKVFLKSSEPTKLFKKIKKKKGVDLDKQEVNYVKRCYSRWRNNQDNENQIFFINK